MYLQICAFPYWIFFVYHAPRQYKWGLWVKVSQVQPKRECLLRAVCPDPSTVLTAAVFKPRLRHICVFEPCRLSLSLDPTLRFCLSLDKKAVLENLGLKCPFCHLIVVQPWANHLASVGLGFWSVSGGDACTYLTRLLCWSNVVKMLRVLSVY